ncbi:MAG TPA: SRPBCC domain-containing protein, partial [Hyphomicrobiaceae bacterium]|nr:SRPBCC domain-containing protein [Hyphomicrobiaceae bacterium]
MKIDVAQVIGAVTRTVERQDRDGRPARVVIAARSYDAEVAEVWDAMTNAERIPRWFLPITGDLRLGGRYQLHGNAGGE